MNVTKVLIIEGAVNLFVTVAKALVGIQTGSMALLADAFHSATDLINNVIAFLLQRIADKPADDDHPYGHKKFEYLGIFVLAVLLCVVAIELVISIFSRSHSSIEQSTVGIVVIIASLLASIGVSLFERYWGKKLNSKLLLADAKHTLADSLTTLAAIAGWQLSLIHLGWLDQAVALVIVAIVLYLAFGLFKQAIPVLVDQAMVDEALVIDTTVALEGVLSAEAVRSRSTGDGVIVELTVKVAANLSTHASHEIADQVEHTLKHKFDLVDVFVHIEPEIL